ncbi:MAG: hypothetical protein HPY45_00020 [Anaerolineae bacterium]|nr:hypothetical protein [Anaerolineae bacterium]
MDANHAELIRARREARRLKRRKQAVWDVLTLLVGVMILVVIGVGVYIFLQPESALNPFPPPTMPASIMLPSQTPVPVQQDVSDGLGKPAQVHAADTQLPTTTAVEPTATQTPTLTVVYPTLPQPSSTPSINVHDIFATLTATAYSAYPYTLKAPPAAIQAFHLPAEKLCHWSGVGGQVIDIQNRPATGILVQLGGYLNRAYYNQTSLTGTALQYGPAGYEFTLGEELKASRKGLWVQLVDQSLYPLSEKVYFDTFNDCSKNLILINFKQVK